MIELARDHRCLDRFGIGGLETPISLPGAAILSRQKGSLFVERTDDRRLHGVDVQRRTDRQHRAG